MSKSYSGFVSVITPAFNAARYLNGTIGSVVDQSYKELEMLVVDDASRDETAEVVQRWTREDSRVRLLRHDRNWGPAEARNTALKAARGQYVAFLDSDDQWVGGKLEAQLKFMAKVRSAFSFTSYRRISESGRMISGVIRVPSRLDYRGLLKNTAIATTTVVIDRSQTGPFEMKKTYYDDFALWLQLMKRGFVAHGLRQDLARYRVVKGSVSRNKLRSAMKVWRAYRDIESLGVMDALWCFANYACNGILKNLA